MAFPSINSVDQLAKPALIRVEDAALRMLADIFAVQERPAPVPARARRQRKRSLTKVCEAARRAGADHVIVDGVVIVLSPAAAVPETSSNEWDMVLPEVDHGPH
jgi:hypothetical protein